VLRRNLDNCIQAVVQRDVHELAIANLLDFVELFCRLKFAIQLFALVIQLDAFTSTKRPVVDGSADSQLFEVVTAPASAILRLVESDDLPSYLCHQVVEFLLRGLSLVLGYPDLAGFDVQLGFQLPVLQVVPALRRDDLLIAKDRTAHRVDALASFEVEVRRARQGPVDDNAATWGQESEQCLEKSRLCLVREEVQRVLQQNDVEPYTSCGVLFKSVERLGASHVFDVMETVEWKFRVGELADVPAT